MTEVAGGADTPPGYNDGETTCCNSNSDCTFDDVCAPNGTASASSIPNRAFCRFSLWYGGDDNPTACSAITGVGNLWNLGGDTDGTACCGDDGVENRRTCVDGGAGACSEAPADGIACCADPNACVYQDGCYSDSETSLRSYTETMLPVVRWLRLRRWIHERNKRNSSWNRP